MAAVSSRGEKEFAYLDYFMYGLPTQIFLYGVFVEIYNACWLSGTRKFKSDDPDLPLRHVEKKREDGDEKGVAPLPFLN